MADRGRSVSVHRTVEGAPDGPVVVLSNSLGTTLEMWEPQMAALAATYRVVRYDMRGHGRSPVPAGQYDVADLGTDLLALLDDIGVGEAHLCGLSLGGLASLWAAAHAPSRVLSLTVMSAPARFGTGEAYRERAATVRANGMASVAEPVVARWLTPAFAARRPDLVEQLRAMIAGIDPQGYAACCEAVASADLRPDLAAVHAPALCVAGAADPALPVADVRTLAEALPGAAFRVIADAAHLLNVERPDEATELIVGHIEAARIATQGAST